MALNLRVKLFKMLWFICLAGCTGQSGLPAEYKLVGGPCEGCDAVFEYGDRELRSVDTLPDWGDQGPKMKITGTVYLPDGKTPAEGVILYIYHTNQEGIYPTRGGETEWDRRHGYIQGWVKTNEKGSYTFYTLKPGTYPSGTEAAHIHPIILEPGGKYYWLNSYFFSGDPLLKSADEKETIRGGPGNILTLQLQNGILAGERDFVLGKNIEGYD